MDASTTCAVHHPAGPTPATANRRQVFLAELHPDTLPAALLASAYGPGERGAIDDGWPGFFHRAHRLLPPDGLLLIATRQHRDHGRLTDRLGLLVLSAVHTAQ
ncbi:hypothetical protein [Streptomyces sp. BH055]|uniref:hypothetical protein n=1 Tax=Streptomyces sp. BH055 TaxID=3401173 RepID=UPI003BB4B77B